MVDGTQQWSLHQSERIWHGIGYRSLCDALDDQEGRYRDAGEIHHTEQLVVADSCPGGWLTLTADLAARSKRAYRMTLSLQLLGVPLDARPLRRLCERLDVERELFLRPRSEPSVATHHLDWSQPLELEVRGWVVDLDVDHSVQERWTRGIVATNPFWRRHGDSVPLPAPLPTNLRDDELLVCDLRDWHPLDEPRPRYVLARLEWAHSSEALVVCPTADWPRDRREAVT